MTAPQLPGPAALSEAETERFTRRGLRLAQFTVATTGCAGRNQGPAPGERDPGRARSDRASTAQRRTAPVAPPHAPTQEETDPCV
jgi:hypothetical protein